MASGKLYNLAKMNTATTGTGTITLSTAVSGFLTFALSGVTNGETVTYIIEDGASRELGYGVYTSSGTTLARNVLKSTNSDSAINLSGSATVGITAARENFLEWFANIDANGFNLGMDDNTGINDDSGNETVRFRKTSSAVNYVEVLNTETTVGPRISAAGDDTNIDLRLAGKGTGGVVGDFKNGSAGLGIKDSDSSHALRITTSSNLTADRILTLVPGDASRTITIPADVNLIAGTVQTFTSSGTWTKPSGCRFIKITCVGGGGAGGGATAAASQVACGLPGSGGAGCIKWLNATALSSETVTVGAGGTGGSGTGGNGGTSSFGAHCSAGGGTGGTANWLTSGTSAGAWSVYGVAQATATGGDIPRNGASPPGATTRTSGTSGSSAGGAEGPFGLGAGGPPRGPGTSGDAATGFGAGGGAGCSNSATNRTGGDGAPGVVIVEEFY